jgi:ATP-dependent RNA helicase DeaD
MISETLGEYTSIEVAAALFRMATDRGTSDTIEESQSSGGDAGFVRYFVTLGRKDGIGVKELIQTIFEKTGIAGRSIGDIALLEKFSFVNIPQDQSSRFMEAMKGAKYNGRRINVEIATKK